MFLGRYKHTVDIKGRLMIPAKFREEIGENKIVVTRWWDDNLAVFTEEDFRKYIDSLTQYQGSPEKKRQILMFFSTNADECKLDGQGRILINKHLRECAGLMGDVVVTGNVDHFEVSSPEVWAKTDEIIDDVKRMRDSLESLSC